MPTAELKVEGKPKVYKRKGESGSEVESYFCDTCGSYVRSSSI